MLTLSDVEAAATRIARSVRHTPIIEAEPAAFGTPNPVILKLELLQHGGSFKPRGIFNRILLAKEFNGLPAAGVIGASGGNAGLAIAYVARELGITAEIFVPEVASKVKVDRLRRLGATVTIAGTHYADAYESCLKRSADCGALLVHSYDQMEVVAGQGTLGLELLTQMDNKIDTVLAAVGGGGLVAGIATALGGRSRVIAVEPEQIPTLHSALAAGEPVDVNVSGIAVDSLGAKRIGDIAFEVAQHTAMESVLVSERAIVEARQRLWDELRISAEHGGATALAALLENAYVPKPDERVAVIICGGNTDPCDLTPSAS